jgi:hypothetical protein
MAAAGKLDAQSPLVNPANLITLEGSTPQPEVLVYLTQHHLQPD